MVSASKSVKILELSEIMVLHLVRFNYGSQGSTKLHKPVHFPLELVFGRELLVSPSSEVIYYAITIYGYRLFFILLCDLVVINWMGVPPLFGKKESLFFLQYKVTVSI